TRSAKHGCRGKSQPGESAPKDLRYGEPIRDFQRHTVDDKMLSHQLVERDRKLADSLPGRMIARIRNGCRGAGDANLPDSSRTVGRLLVRDIQKVHFNIRNIAINRNVVFRKRWIQDSALTLVEQGLFC